MEVKIIFCTITTLFFNLFSIEIALGKNDEKGFTYVDASNFTIIGKIMDTKVPYARVDTAKYKGWSEWENFEVRTSTGLAVMFKTDSKIIKVLGNYGELYNGVSTNILSHRGYDLYIMKNGTWLWAGAACPPVGKEDMSVNLISGMDGSLHECLMYLPIFSELRGLKIGVIKGSILAPLESSFRHRIGIYGSSFTHGASTGRAGMTYPAIFSRRTGIQLVNLAMSGHCTMQSYAVEVLKDADVDGFIFDTFSNPSPNVIKSRLFPFIEEIQSTHDNVPLIFQRTIRRENRNFDKVLDAEETERIHVADSMMAIACKKYKNVYYIYPNASEKNHEASIDGTHPSNYGYELWEASIEKKIVRILKKYGIK